MENTIINESEVDNLNNEVSKSNDHSETDEHTADFDKTLPTEFGMVVQLLFFLSFSFVYFFPVLLYVA